MLLPFPLLYPSMSRREVTLNRLNMTIQSSAAQPCVRPTIRRPWLRSKRGLSCNMVASCLISTQAPCLENRSTSVTRRMTKTCWWHTPALPGWIPRAWRSPTRIVATLSMLKREEARLDCLATAHLAIQQMAYWETSRREKGTTVLCWPSDVDSM